MKPADSPCIRQCGQLPHIDWCQGCFRTTAEIRAWPRARDAERRRVLGAIAKRRQQHTEAERQATRAARLKACAALLRLPPPSGDHD